MTIITPAKAIPVTSLAKGAYTLVISTTAGTIQQVRFLKNYWQRNNAVLISNAEKIFRL